MDNLIRRLTNLLSVKSLVTIVLTIVFAVLTVKGSIPSEFQSIYSMVITFYFVTGGNQQPTTYYINGGDNSNGTS